VSFETSFNSKQPKLEPKLVLALSETKRLFRLFRFYTETESFDVSIEPKQAEDQPKQERKKERTFVYLLHTDKK
jgi:preprotein translocase subunit Sec61beta